MPDMDADCAIAVHGARPIPVNRGIRRRLSRTRTTRPVMIRNLSLESRAVGFHSGWFALDRVIGR